MQGVHNGNIQVGKEKGLHFEKILKRPLDKGFLQKRIRFVVHGT